MNRTSFEPERIVHTAAFRRLVIARWTVSLILSFLMMTAYFGFIFLIALGKEVLSKQLGSVPLGIYLGIGLILTAWLLTGVYTFWANRSYDQQVEALRNEFSQQGGRT